MLKKFISWVKANLGNDPNASNSRVLQTVIVLNLTAILWVVMAKSNPAWTISDNTRLVMLTLITAGAGSYVVNKVTGG